MKSDEKTCPKCAEVIKKAAIVCKHCGHQFSADEIAAEKRRESENTRNGTLGCLGLLGLLVLIGMCSPGSEKNSPDIPAKSGKAAADPVEKQRGPYASVARQYAWIERSKAQISARLKDPGSAEFRNVHFYSGGGAPVACGEVNAKNSFGGYTGFERFIAAGSQLAVTESDMTSPGELEKVWKRMCVRGPDDEA